MSVHRNNQVDQQMGQPNADELDGYGQESCGQEGPQEWRDKREGDPVLNDRDGLHLSGGTAGIASAGGRLGTRGVLARVGRTPLAAAAAARAVQRRRGERRREQRRWARRPARPLAEVSPGRYGWPGPSGGSTTIVDAPPEWRGPSVQVAGLFPFSAGGSLPMIGAALGPHLFGRGMVCADPVSWFAAGLINNPSAFVLGRPGLGKSSLVCRLLIQLQAKGIAPLVLSDVKGEYVPLIGAHLGGQVISPGRGREFVNPLDLGPLTPRLRELPEALRVRALADMEARRHNVLVGLCELALGTRLDAHERSLLAAAPRLWEQLHTTPPADVLADLTDLANLADGLEGPDSGGVDDGDEGPVPVVADVLELIRSRPDRLAGLVQDRGDPGRYADRTERVVDALTALAGQGEFGEVFAHETTSPLEMSRGAVFDLSAIDGLDARLQAGLQLVCWSYGSAAVTAAKYLGDAGLGPRRSYVMVMDELWRALRAAEFMVDRVDEITRLNRTLNLAQVLVTHTMDDLKLVSAEATAKAFGFVARAEMVFLGGLAPGEMGNLEQVFAMSRQERDMITSWSVPGRVGPDGTSEPPPGRGRFLLKVGKEVGTPFAVALTPAEAAAHDTNASWRDTIASLHQHQTHQPPEQHDQHDQQQRGSGGGTS